MWWAIEQIVCATVKSSANEPPNIALTGRGMRHHWITNKFTSAITTALKPGIDGMMDSLMLEPWLELQSIIDVRLPRSE